MPTAASTRLCDTHYRDIDLVAAKKQGKPTLKMLEAAGYEANERFNAMNGGRRLVVYDMQNGRQLDVFVGDFEMCHKIPIVERLQSDPVTIPLAELLLGSSSRSVNTNKKDVLDICAILLDHEIGRRTRTPSTPTISPRCSRVTGACGGLHRGTVETTRAALPDLEFGEDERATIDGRLTDAVGARRAEPKSLRWRSRAKVGDRTTWYQSPKRSSTEHSTRTKPEGEERCQAPVFTPRPAVSPTV